MRVFVRGSADDAHVSGVHDSLEDHARFISELVESNERLDLTVKLIREDRPEQEYKLVK